MAENVTVRKRKNSSGKTIYEYRVEIASMDGKRQWLSKAGFHSKREAMADGIKALSDYNFHGEKISPTEMSFADYLDYWMRGDCEFTPKKVTLTNYRKKIDTYNLGVLK